MKKKFKIGDVVRYLPLNDGTGVVGPSAKVVGYDNLFPGIVEITLGNFTFPVKENELELSK